jgi:methylglyoxal synthase
MYKRDIKKIALVAHDNRKEALLNWVDLNYKFLIQNKLVCTGTTGRLVEERIQKRLRSEYELYNDTRMEDQFRYDLDIVKLRSGPLGGDMQIGGMIAEHQIDLIVFLWDPMQAQPHDADVKALLRISVLYDIPTACNLSTADYIITSKLLEEYSNKNLYEYADMY